MALKPRLEDELRKALKAKSTHRVNAIREILGALNYAELNKTEKPGITEQDEMAVLSKLKKRHLESIEAFAKGNRPELVDKEKAELKVIEEFLPAMMTGEEIAAMVKTAIADLSAQGMKDMGKVMASLKDKYLGRADGKQVSEEVKRQLSELAVG